MYNSRNGEKPNALIDAYNSADGEIRKEFFLWLNDNRYSLTELIEVLGKYLFCEGKIFQGKKLLSL
jgi:hypothetical protein